MSVSHIYVYKVIRRPFDRVLIAQATEENLELVTTDGDIPGYASVRFRVVS